MDTLLDYPVNFSVSFDSQHPVHPVTYGTADPTIRQAFALHGISNYEIIETEFEPGDSASFVWVTLHVQAGNVQQAAELACKQASNALLNFGGGVDDDSTQVGSSQPLNEYRINATVSLSLPVHATAPDKAENEAKRLIGERIAQLLNDREDVRIETDICQEDPPTPSA